MLTEDFINKNKGRLFWVYTVCRTDSYSGRKELIRTFFDEEEAEKYCDEMNINPHFSRFYGWIVEKNKIIV